MAKIMIANTTQLKEHFIEKLKTYTRPLPDYNSIDILNLTKSEQKTLILEYIRYMFENILWDIPEVLESAIVSYNKDISFLIDDESKKKYIVAKAEELKKKHQKNRYSNIFSVDGFHNEIFTNNSLEAIINELLEILEKGNTIDSLYYENEDGEIDYSNPNLNKIENFIIVNKYKFRDTFFVILKTLVLKLEYRALSNTSTSQSILPIIPSNKPCKSEEISIVPPNPYLLVQNRSEEKQESSSSLVLLDNENNIEHLELNLNYWNNKCYDLFKYLYENYYLDGNKTNRSLLNIWFYLIELQKENSTYRFEYTKEEYIGEMIRSYSVKITNLQKNKARYLKFDKPKMESHREIFEEHFE